MRTVRAGSPHTSGEGLRVGVVRFEPRGVPKHDYAHKNYFDVWLPILAPSRSFLTQFKKAGMPVQTFFRRYHQECSRRNPGKRSFVRQLDLTESQDKNLKTVLTSFPPAAEALTFPL